MAIQHNGFPILTRQNVQYLSEDLAENLPEEIAIQNDALRRTAQYTLVAILIFVSLVVSACMAR